MPRYHSNDGTNQNANPQVQIVECPLPISYALPEETTGTIDTFEGLSESLDGLWPPKGWNGMDPVQPDNVPSDYDGSSHRGGTPQGQPPRYAWRYLAEYEAHGCGVHENPPTMSQVHESKKPPKMAEKGIHQEPTKPKHAASCSGGNNDVAKLLEGFTIMEEVRKGGKSTGHKDKFYIHIETGKKLRSLKEVERFKMTGSAKKTRPLASTSISHVAHMGQPLQHTMQKSSQQVATSSASRERENTAGGGQSAAGGEGVDAAVGGEDAYAGEGNNASI